MLKLSAAAVSGRLKPIDLSVEHACQIHLVGPNGAGKSTLLARIAGLLAGPGQIVINNKPIVDYTPAQLARVRAYLYQQQSCHNLMPVFQYLDLHKSRAVAPLLVQETVEYLGNKLELLDKLTKPITQLSGGEWQRVRLAAIFLQIWPTINSDSKILLLDEPMNSLDIGQQVALNQLIAELVKLGRIVITSTHDLNQTLHYADRVWLMEQGEIIADGEVDEVMTAQNISGLFKVNFARYSVNNMFWLAADVTDII